MKAKYWGLLGIFPIAVSLWWFIGSLDHIEETNIVFLIYNFFVLISGVGFGLMLITSKKFQIYVESFVFHNPKPKDEATE